MKLMGDRLKEAREDAKLTQDQLAARSGVSQGLIGQIESGRNKGSRYVFALASALQVSPLWLAEGKGSRQPGLMNVMEGPEIRGRVPLISWVAASNFAAAVDNFQPGDAEEWVETTKPVNQHTYALRVSGSSMTNPTGQEPTFPDGSKIIVEPNLIDRPERLVNLFVIVRREEEGTATFKQLIRDGDKFILHPLNPQFPNIELQEGDVFCGVVREKPVSYV